MTGRSGARDRSVGAVRAPRNTLTRSRIALLGLAAALVLTGGLASAGVLPNPVQGAVAGVVDHLGFHFPRSADLPDKASHGEDVSNIARSARGEHCRSGKAVAHVASSLAKGRRRNDPPALDTCARSRPGRSPTAGSTSLTKGHSRQGLVGGPYIRRRPERTSRALANVTDSSGVIPSGRAEGRLRSP